MDRKLTVNIEVIDPRVGDNFGFKVSNDGQYLTFTQSGLPDSNGWNKTYVGSGGTTSVVQVNRFLQLDSDLNIMATQSYGGVTNGTIACVLAPSSIVPINSVSFVGNFTQWTRDNINIITSNRIISVQPTSYTNYGSGLDFYAGKIIEDNTGTSNYIAGSFNNYKGYITNNFVKTNSVGDISIIFRDNMMSNPNASQRGFNSQVKAIAVQADSKVICGGLFTNFNGNARNRIVRLNYLGQLDSTFNVGTGFDSDVNDFAIQSDGKIICVGAFTKYFTTSTTKNRIVRISNLGAIDTGFTTTGLFGGSGDVIECVKLQSDGKILVGGFFTNKIARLLTSGVIDPSFNVGTGFAYSLGNARVFTIEVLTTGKIVVGGTFDSYDGNPCGHIVMLNSDGTFYKSLTLNYGIQDFGAGVVRSIKRDASNNLYVGGNFTNYLVSTLYTATGSLYSIPLSNDITFNFGTAFDGTVYKSTIYNNEIICFGDFTTYKTTNICNSVAKLTLDGEFIDGFTGTTEEISYNAIVLSDGSFIIAGVDNANGIDVSALGYIIKFNNDLTQDVTFNSGEDGFSYKPYNFSFDPEIPFITKKNDDSNIIFGLSNYDGDYNGNSIDFFNPYEGRLICINSNGDYISREQIGRDWYSLYYNNDESRIIFNSVQSSIDGFLQIYNSSFIIQTTLRGVFRSLELSNGNIVIKGEFIDGSSYFDKYGVYSYSFGIISPDGLTSIKENSGVGLNDNSLPNNNIWTDGEFIYVYNNSTGITYNGINVNKLFRLNQDLEIDTSFNYSGNILIKDILFKSNYILLLGDDIEVINYDGDIINSIGDIENNVQNTYDNLVEFNSGPGITYSIVDNVVRMEYEFEDDEVVVTDVFDTPDHVEITYVNESITINEKIKEMVTRSDYNYINDQSGTYSYTNFKIKIYEGGLFSGASASSFKFNITKPKLLSTQSNIYIEISNLIREDFEWEAAYFYSNDITEVNLLPNNVSKWVYIEETNYSGTASVGFNKAYLFAIDGFLYNTEEQGVPNILSNGRKKYINREQTQRVYFQSNFLDTITVTHENGYTFNPIFDVNLTLDNRYYIQSLKIDNSVAGGRWVDYTFTYTDPENDTYDETIRYYFNDRCSDNKYYELIFKNKWGVLESLAVNKRSKLEYNIETEEFYRSIVDINGNYDINRHGLKDRQFMADETYILNTDVMPEYMNDTILDIYLSDEVWLKGDNNIIPVILDKSFTPKYRVDGPITYTFKAKCSHKKIRKIL